MTIQRRETFIQASTEPGPLPRLVEDGDHTHQLSGVVPFELGSGPVQIRAWEQLLFEGIGYIGAPADIAQR
jgi:hypothetical protein